MTWLPAPIAYSISVAVGESDTIACGRDATFTVPLAAESETGKPGPAAAAVPLPEVAPVLLAPVSLTWVLLHAAAGHGERGGRREDRKAAGQGPHDHPPWAQRMRRPPRDPGWIPDEPPFLRGQIVGTGQASGLIPGRVSPSGASPLRDSAGISPASLGSMPSRATRDRRTLPQPATIGRDRRTLVPIAR